MGAWSCPQPGEPQGCSHTPHTCHPASGARSQHVGGRGQAEARERTGVSSETGFKRRCIQACGCVLDRQSSNPWALAVSRWARQQWPTEHLRSGQGASAWPPTQHVSPGRPCHLLLKPPRFTPDSQGDPPACALAGSLTQDPQEGTSGRKVQGPLRGRAWDTGFKCAGQAASL